MKTREEEMGYVMGQVETKLKSCCDEIEKINDKVESMVKSKLFYWAAGLAATAIAFLFNYQIGIQGTLTNIAVSISEINTKLEFVEFTS